MDDVVPGCSDAVPGEVARHRGIGDEEQEHEGEPVPADLPVQQEPEGEENAAFQAEQLVGLGEEAGHDAIFLCCGVSSLRL